jgi:hypothetical protein
VLCLLSAGNVEIVQRDDKRAWVVRCEERDDDGIEAVDDEMMAEMMIEMSGGVDGVWATLRNEALDDDDDAEAAIKGEVATAPIVRRHVIVSRDTPFADRVTCMKMLGYRDATGCSIDDYASTD